MRSTACLLTTRAAAQTCNNTRLTAWALAGSGRAAAHPQWPRTAAATPRCRRPSTSPTGSAVRETIAVGEIVTAIVRVDNGVEHLRIPRKHTREHQPQ